MYKTNRKVVRPAVRTGVACVCVLRMPHTGVWRVYSVCVCGGGNQTAGSGQGELAGGLGRVGR
jgi:hypothetical protein